MPRRYSLTPNTAPTPSLELLGVASAGDHRDALLARLTRWGERHVRLLASLALHRFAARYETLPIAGPETTGRPSPDATMSLATAPVTTAEETFAQSDADSDTEFTEFVKQLGFEPIDIELLGFAPLYDRPGPLTFSSTFPQPKPRSQDGCDKT